jgi:ectoine hydroxylase-related dioxygenase (phytanoyl-CoA dioxygenase family)
MDSLSSSIAVEVGASGFALARAAADEALLNKLLHAVEDLLSTMDEVSSTYGLRGLLARSGRCRALAANPALLNLAKAVLGPKAQAVKGIYFDKNEDANWLVPWHQDCTITVMERVDIPGFGPWSEKEGIVHVQPPARILEGLVTLRIHLDDAGTDNGALRVLPGTHRHGRIPSGEISKYIETISPVICEAKRGDVLVMRPLLLHFSPPSVTPSHRRVIHLEYSAVDLPGGLEWCG